VAFHKSASCSEVRLKNPSAFPSLPLFVRRFLNNGWDGVRFVVRLKREGNINMLVANVESKRVSEEPIAQDVLADIASLQRKLERYLSGNARGRGEFCRDAKALLVVLQYFSFGMRLIAPVAD